MEKKKMIVDKLVDSIMDEGFETYSKIKTAIKRADLILDNLQECVEDDIDNLYPCHKLQNDTEEDIETADSEELVYDTDVNDISHVPSQEFPVQYKELVKQLGESVIDESEYQKFFKKKMRQKNIKSLADLSPEEKKKFFKEVKRDWQNIKVLKRITS